MPRLSTERLWGGAPQGSPTGCGRLSPATGVAWDSTGPKAAERKNSAASGGVLSLVAFFARAKRATHGSGAEHPRYKHRARRALQLFALTISISLAASSLAAENTCRAGTVYLTFDTGTMRYAEWIADTLDREKIKATFFLANEPTFRGDHSLDPSWAPYWKRLARAGHRFGNHTWSHLYRPRDRADGRVEVTDLNYGSRKIVLDQAGFCRELKRVDDTFNRDTGQRLSGMWRAPGGRTTDRTLRWAASCGYPVHVGWTDAGFIGDELPSSQHPNPVLLERALKNIRGGDIILFHLGIQSRAEPAQPLLAPLIRGLRERGFCFATLDAPRR